jgi:hypothetical protein
VLDSLLRLFQTTTKHDTYFWPFSKKSDIFFLQG